MRRLIVVVVAFAVVATALHLTPSAISDVEAARLFAEFKRTYNKTYASAAEERRRFHIFAENLPRTADAQKRNPLAKFGDVTLFADLTAEEFRRRYHNGGATLESAVREHRQAPKLPKRPLNASAAAGTVCDWRERGAVTYVRNQGICGSCWAFSTVGNVEGQWFLAGHDLIALSEQELVSCDFADGNDGCQGGWATKAVEWLISDQRGYITGEQDLPYVSAEGRIPQCPRHVPWRARVTGLVRPPSDEQSMAQWVYDNGPLSVGVSAQRWKAYRGGVVTDCGATQIDHYVLIVGFHTRADPPYWIIKNSWSTAWGMDGYIYVEMFTDQCLLASIPSSAVASSAPIPTAPPAPGPFPPPPPPPPPPVGANFTEVFCDDSRCSTNCKSTTYPTNTCMPTGASTSSIGSCVTPGFLTRRDFSQTSSCAGESNSYNYPVHQCNPSSGERYYYVLC